MANVMLLTSVAAMLLAYAGPVLAQAVRGEAALPRSPAKQQIMPWIRFWSTHVKHSALYCNRAPPLLWPLTTT